MPKAAKISIQIKFFISLQRYYFFATDFKSDIAKSLIISASYPAVFLKSEMNVSRFIKRDERRPFH